ncbi:ATP-binding cassette domain-containing protein [Heliobacillus mobilis]|uniref:ATP-binding cassette domain-containing protein n=1 Tax=Heliobacterium mobile TaxID=28064 RepID=A0A6I3SIK1_HELMO|nr:ATP-binding cassette domain-containing protein [Heliobacterium mobile]MTV48688.1 ATP-binding cassette domain-containing protein [Heliobacterium mobile]
MNRQQHLGKNRNSYRHVAVAVTFVFIASIGLIENLYILTALLLGMWSLGFFSGVGLRTILSRLVWLVPFLALTLLLFPFWYPGETFWVWTAPWGGNFQLSLEGLQKALRLGLRVAVAVSSLTVLMESMSRSQFFQALRRLRIPALFLQLAELILRYVEVFRDEARRMSRARKARGYEEKGGILNPHVRAVYAGFLGTLMLRAMDRAERVYLAMLARGYSATDSTDGPSQPPFDGPIDREHLAMDRAKPDKFKLDQFELEETTEPLSDSTWRLGQKGEGSRLATGRLQVKNLSYRYPGSNRPVDALCQIQLKIEPGQKVALLGPNGAGKSTLIHHLCGLIIPQSGEVRIDDLSLTRDTAREIRRHVGLVFQDPDDQLFCGTVAEDVAFGPQNLGLPEEEVEKRVESALAAVQGLDLARYAPHQLSYGQKKRVAIAGVLAMDPDILILDEPMAYLDPQGQDEVMQILQDCNCRGKTIIMAIHDIDLAESWADRVIILQDGALLADGGTEILENEKLLQSARLLSNFSQLRKRKQAIE